MFTPVWDFTSPTRLADQLEDFLKQHDLPPAVSIGTRYYFVFGVRLKRQVRGWVIMDDPRGEGCFAVSRSGSLYVTRGFNSDGTNWLTPVRLWLEVAAEAS